MTQLMYRFYNPEIRVTDVDGNHIDEIKIDELPVIFGTLSEVNRALEDRDLPPLDQWIDSDSHKFDSLAKGIKSVMAVNDKGNISPFGKFHAHYTAFVEIYEKLNANEAIIN